jgi:uncharacterized delta-60 repeat protein
MTEQKKTMRWRSHGKSFAVCFVAACTLILMWATPVRAAPGALDPTFGWDGRVMTTFTSGAVYASDTAIQQDGKIVVVGTVDPTGSNDERIALARYNANGTLDGTFGGDGRVTTGFRGGNDVGNAVAIQSNGKIVVAGTASPARATQDALVRYRPNGSLDPTFGGDGRVTTTQTTGATGLAIQADGKIVVVNANGQSVVLVRYLRDGSLDRAFGIDGIVTTSVTDWFAGDARVAIQTDGKIVVAGDATTQALWGGFFVVRYDTDGNLDTAFGTDGIATVNLTKGGDWLGAVAIQPDGKIVVAGDAGFCCEYSGKFGLARLDAEGNLDPTFGRDGRVITTFTPNPNYEDTISDVAVLANGKIVAVGVAGAGWGSVSAVAVARYNPDGSLDSTFGTGGKVTTAFPYLGTKNPDIYVGARASAVAIQANGKILVAGTQSGENSARDRILGRFVLARYSNR